MGSAEPLVSVITPTFNHESLIGECIQSVLNQSYANWEMIIVDDGSTDATAAVVMSFDDPRVKLFQQKNKGPNHLGETYNFALSKASGELVAILEGDDFWPAEKLATQVQDFQDEAVVLSWGLARIVTFDGHELSITPPKLPPHHGCVNDPVGRATYTMLQPDWMTFAFPVTVVMRKATLDKIGGFIQAPYFRTVDLSTFLALGLEGRWAFRDEVCGIWRRHPDSITRNELPTIFNNAYRLCAEFVRANRAKLGMSKLQVAWLARQWGSFQYERCLLLGRMFAADHKFKESDAFFRRAGIYPLSFKSRVLLGIARGLVGLRLSPEVVFKLAGKSDWQAQYNRDLDPIVSLDMDPEDFGTESFA